jgi:hypothetical protein
VSWKSFLEVKRLFPRRLEVWNPIIEAKKILFLKKLGSSESGYGSGSDFGSRVLMTKN